jgi:hypothetical protein
VGGGAPRHAPHAAPRPRRRGRARGRCLGGESRRTRRGAPPIPPNPRLGASWDDKKSICNKFAQSSGVTCLAWAPGRHGDVCFGLADGKVKLGMLQTNKTYTLYAHAEGSPVTALAASPDGRSLVSGHADGSLYAFTFPEAQVCRRARAATLAQGQRLHGTALRLAAPRPSQPPLPARAQDGTAAAAGCFKLTAHSCAPAALAWGESIVATGGDCRVAFYDPTSGAEQAAFDHGGDDEARAFGSVAVNPAGDGAVVGAFDRLYVFTRGGGGKWAAAGVKQVREGAVGHAGRRGEGQAGATCLLASPPRDPASCWPLTPAPPRWGRCKTCLPPRRWRGSRTAPSWRWGACAATWTCGTRASSARGDGGGRRMGAAGLSV